MLAPFLVSFLVIFVVIMIAVTLASKFWDNKRKKQVSSMLNFHGSKGWPKIAPTCNKTWSASSRPHPRSAPECSSMESRWSRISGNAPSRNKETEKAGHAFRTIFSRIRVSFAIHGSLEIGGPGRGACGN